MSNMNEDQEPAQTIETEYSRAEVEASRAALMSEVSNLRDHLIAPDVIASETEIRGAPDAVHRDANVMQNVIDMFDEIMRQDAVKKPTIQKSIEEILDGNMFVHMGHASTDMYRENRRTARRQQIETSAKLIYDLVERTYPPLKQQSVKDMEMSG